MKHILKILKHLVLTSFVTGLLMFLPVTGAFIERVPAGLFIVAGVVALMIFVIGRIKRRTSRMDPVMAAKAQADANEYWEKSSKATFSPSESLDLRNVTKIDSLFK